MKATCLVNGCEKPASTRGWCEAHYTRWLRNGDVGGPTIATKGVWKPCGVDGCARRATSNGYCCAHDTRVRRTGDPGAAAIWDKRPKVCKIEGCEQVARSLGMCNAHHLRWATHGDLNRDGRKANNFRWLDRDALNYDAAHDRVKRYRGAPSEHVCECGQPAEDWAYLHSDPDPLVDDRGRLFTDDIEGYAPMCRHCHKTFDWEQKRKRERIVGEAG